MQTGTTIHISVTCPVKKMFIDNAAIERDDFQIAVSIDWFEQKVQRR
jgi:hypothetical protein